MKADGETDIEDIALFAGCTHAELEFIMSTSTRTLVPAGLEVSRQGQTDRQCVVILSGEVCVEHDCQQVAIAGVGEVIGEIGLIEGGVAHRTARTITECELLVFTSNEFASMMSAIPRVALKIQRDAIHHLLEIDSLHSHSGPDSTPVP